MLNCEMLIFHTTTLTALLSSLVDLMMCPCGLLFYKKKNWEKLWVGTSLMEDSNGKIIKIFFHIFVSIFISIFHSFRKLFKRSYLSPPATSHTNIPVAL